MRTTHLKITYSDQEDLASSDAIINLSTGAFLIDNADSGIVTLNLKGKTSGVLSFEMEIRTNILPAVTIKSIKREARNLRYSAFSLTTVNATDEDNIPSLFDFKNLRGVFATNHLDGDPVTRFQVTLPTNAQAGSILNNVGGLKGVSIKLPTLTRSPIVNVMVPTFMLEGHPEVKALDYSEKHGAGKPVRVAVDLKDTDWSFGQKVDVLTPVGPLGRLKMLSFVCPRFNPKSGSSRVVMVQINRDDEYFGIATTGSSSTHTFEDDELHHNYGSHAGEEQKVSWEVSPLRNSV